MTTKLKLCLAFMLCLLAANTFAQNEYWETTPGPPGGAFDLVQTVDGSLYAINQFVNWKECYRSTDQGETWEPLTFLWDFFPGEDIKQVKISESGAIYLHIHSQGTYYKTVNMGQSWTTAYSFDLELPDGTLFKIVQPNSVQRSTDAGQNWSTVLSYPIPFNGSISYPHIYTSPYGGVWLDYRRRNASNIEIRTLYYSSDKGLTWTEQDLDLNLSNLYYTPTGTQLAIINDTLYRSTDNGLNFEATGGIKTTIASFNIVPPNRLLLGTYNELLYSDNDGLSWDTLTTQQDGGGGVLYQIKPLANGAIFKNNNYSLSRSNNGGQTWQFSGYNMYSSYISEMKFISDSTYYVNTPIGLWKTTNAGLDWNLLFQKKSNLNYGRLLETSSSNDVVYVYANKLFWSEDSGATFQEATPPNGLNTGWNRLYLNPITEYLYLNTNAGVERSINHGQSWEVLFDSMQLSCLAFHPSGRIIACLGNQNIIVSDDNGDSWSQQTLINDYGFNSILITPNGEAFMLGMNNNSKAYFWKSEDAGNTWFRMPYEVEPFLWWSFEQNLAAAANGHIFSGADKTISLSVNEGTTWQNIMSPIDSSYMNQYWAKLNCIAISPDQRLYVGTSHFGILKSKYPVSQGATIQGNVKVDQDDNCATFDGQDALANRIIQAKNEDNFTYLTTTDPNGRYVLFVDTGTYVVKKRQNHALWWQNCDSSYVSHLPNYYMTDTVNFSEHPLADCPLITVNIAAPRLRRCFDNMVFVEYCNFGTQPADSAWVDIFLDPFLSLVSSAQPYISLGANTIRFFVGDLEREECGSFNFIVHVDCDSTVLGQTHCILAHGYPDTLCTELPTWSGANIEANAACQDSTAVFELKNTGPANSQILNYIIIEDDVVMLSGQHQYNSNQSFNITWPANGHTVRLESEQEPGHPFSTQVIAFQEGCGGFESLGFINQFSVNGITPSWHRICVENTGSFDPNDKQGFPTGIGAEHQIRPGQSLEYMIRFQNTGTDTAFNIVLRDTLSQWLDPASVTPGAASHPYSWTLNGQNEIVFSFYNILLPDSSTNLSGSQGFVTFQIAQQAQVPLGTQIFNQAAIYFDFNEPVLTNTTLHTVDELDISVNTREWERPLRIDVMPNPARDYALFRLKNGSLSGHHLQVFDGFGKLISTQKISGNQHVFARNNLPAGAYGWRVTDAGGRVTGAGVLVLGR